MWRHRKTLTYLLTGGRDELLYLIIIIIIFIRLKTQNKHKHTRKQKQAAREAQTPINAGRPYN